MKKYITIEGNSKEIEKTINELFESNTCVNVYDTLAKLNLSHASMAVAAKLQQACSERNNRHNKLDYDAVQRKHLK